MSDLISFPFERLDGPAPFADAICLSPDEAAALQPGALEALQDARFQAWLAVVSPAEEV